MFNHRKEYLRIKRSGFFDPYYYLLNYPDVRLADIDPLSHFIEHGWRESRNPSEFFDTHFYLESYPDVKKTNLNPLMHYLLFGEREGRKINANSEAGKRPNQFNSIKSLSTSEDTNSKSGKIVFCTANAANYIPRALTFAESVKKYYGKEAIVICCVVERNLDCLGNRKYNFIDQFLSVNDLNIPALDKTAFEHTLLEMSCFVRPFLMEVVFQKFPDATAYYYMDCDTWLNSRLFETDSLLANQTCNIVLTPHTVDPPDLQKHEGERIHERADLRHGTFNLGFLGIANNPYAKGIITDWWKERVISSCFWDIAEGVFVDQKWWNPAPYMFDGIFVETSRGYNYASWTIMRRTIEKINGNYFINGDPLRFGHFSATFNGHMGYAPVYGIEDRKTMLDTLRDYCDPYYRRVQYYDKAGFSNMQWSFGTYQSGQEVLDSVRVVYRKQLKNWMSWNPYEFSNEELMRYAGNDTSSESRPTVSASSHNLFGKIPAGFKMLNDKSIPRPVKIQKIKNQLHKTFNKNR